MQQCSSVSVRDEKTPTVIVELFWVLVVIRQRFVLCHEYAQPQVLCKSSEAFLFSYDSQSIGHAAINHTMISQCCRFSVLMDDICTYIPDIYIRARTFPTVCVAYTTCENVSQMCLCFVFRATGGAPWKKLAGETRGTSGLCPGSSSQGAPGRTKSPHSTTFPRTCGSSSWTELMPSRFTLPRQDFFHVIHKYII